ncbi:MAG: tyrosine--tRNA ligase [Candidatus Saccharimonadales bacterium]
MAGVDLVRRIDNQEVHVYTAPLVINKTTGKKFGKSEDGAVWLDPDMTSVYQFYQFWLNVDDEGVEDYLKIYTLLSKEETERILLDFNRNRAGRLAQKTLAYEVTKIVHGKERADSVKRISEVLFGGRSYNELTQADFEALGKEIGIIATKDGTELAELLVQARLAKSKSEARRFITSGAIYINGIQVAADDLVLRADQSINGHYILRRGKNSQIVLAL